MAATDAPEKAADEQEVDPNAWLDLLPNTLQGALCRFQAEAPKIDKNETAKVKTKKKDGTPGPEYSYDYVSLTHLHEVVLPLITRLGLTWVTMPVLDDNGRPALHYKLTYAPTETGEPEHIAGTMPLMLNAGGPQELGSAITYARRYALVAVLGLSPDKDEDGQLAQDASKAPSAQQTREAEKLSKAAAEKMAAYADEIQVLGEPLQRAIGYVLDKDPGKVDGIESATKALQKLDKGQGEAIQTWLNRKAQQGGQ